MSLKRTSKRDTARDIILGTAPSGRGPRQPKGGIAAAKRSQSSDGIIRRAPSSDRRPKSEASKVDTRALDSLSREIDRLQRQNKDLLEHEKSARKRLEANQDALQRKISGGASARELNDLRRQIGQYEKEIGNYGGEIKKLRSHIDRQNSELTKLQKDLLNRPQVDPNKIANATSAIDGRVKELQNQLSNLKQNMDKQQNERDRDAKIYADNLARLQDHLRESERSKNDGVNNLERKLDTEKEKLREENRRLADKLNATQQDVNKSLSDVDKKIAAELAAKAAANDKALRDQIARQAAFEEEVMKQLTEQIANQQKQIEALAATLQADRNKYKERFTKVNEALAALEHHLDLGNKKIDKIVNAEIQSRKLHEKGLLQKVSGMEDKLNGYISQMNKSIEDAKAGKENVKVPTLDVDALRREMESIAADKNKLSMEGLLMLEEKMSAMQTGFAKDRREVADRAASITDEGRKGSAGGRGSKADERNRDNIKSQLDKMDALHDDMEKTHERIRDKVERQIPQDLNELSAKADNIKHQLNTRIDKEEEERYMAIKELQEAFSTLQEQANARAASAVRNSGAASANEARIHEIYSLRRDVEECKVAIKKLAESIATVKNVLDKKINTEIRTRERDINQVNQRISGIGQQPPAYNRTEQPETDRTGTTY